jgi:hypothetical protein
VVEQQRREGRPDGVVAGHDGGLLFGETYLPASGRGAAPFHVNSDGLSMALLPAAMAVASGISASANG